VERACDWTLQRAAKNTLREALRYVTAEQEAWPALHRSGDQKAPFFWDGSSLLRKKFSRTETSAMFFELGKSSNINID
jgi:hypothetical protein